MLGWAHVLREEKVDEATSVRALDAIRSVCRPGGLLFVESVCEPPPATDAALPLWRFSPRDAFRGDGTTKWVPTLAGLEAVIGDCQFEVLASAARGERCIVVARAVLLCASLQKGAMIPELQICPTFMRDTSADIETARWVGAPDDTPDKPKR